MNTIQTKIKAILNTHGLDKNYGLDVQMEKAITEELTNLFKAYLTELIGPMEKPTKHARCEVEFEINSGWYCNTHGKHVGPNDRGDTEVVRNEFRAELLKKISGK